MRKLETRAVAQNILFFFGIIIAGILTATPKDETSTGTLLLSPLIIFYEPLWAVFFQALTFSVTFWSAFFWSFFKDKISYIIPSSILILAWLIHIITDISAPELIDIFVYIKLTFLPLSGYFIGSVFHVEREKVLFIKRTSFLYRVALIVSIYFLANITAGAMYFFNMLIYKYPPFDEIFAISQVLYIDYALLLAWALSVVFWSSVIFSFLGKATDYVFVAMFLLFGVYVYINTEDVTPLMYLALLGVAVVGNLIGYALKVARMHFFPSQSPPRGLTSGWEIRG